MTTSILVIGESGSGKSTSIRTLNPDETYIITVMDKPLPFRNKYRKSTVKENTKIPGNIFASDQFGHIKSAIMHISKERPEIKNIVIDDFQYIMANEFMRRSSEKGYQKFTEIAQHTWEIVIDSGYCRPDLMFFFLTHSDQDANGKYKAKTIGKLLDEKITFEGLFTIVLHTLIQDEKYLFLTQNDGVHIAKSPIDLFDERYIPNDLQYVRDKVCVYYQEEDVPQ